MQSCIKIGANTVKRNTYEARIKELRGTEHSYRNTDTKALPDRPPERDSKESYSERLSIVTDDDEGDATAGAIPIGNEQQHRPKQPHVGMLAHVPTRRQSLQTSPYRAQGRIMRTSGQLAYPQLLRFHSQGPDQLAETTFRLETPLYEEYMPPPLSPRRPQSPAPKTTTRDVTQSSTDPSAQSDESNQSDSVRHGNGENTSWLNTINESSGSSSSSVHSRRSSIGLRRKHIRATSGQTEADFDAALDAAVEAAHDDGFEPDDEDEGEELLLNDPQYQISEPEPLSHLRRNVELAKENVREVEREAVMAQSRERERQGLRFHSTARDSIDDELMDEDYEEERMLEEMTRDYIMDDLEYDVQTKSALPRQSDSSGFSGRTWGSSIGSNPTSTGTSLSTVAEASILPSMDTQLKGNPLPPPPHPPPSTSLPPPPTTGATTLFQPPNSTMARPPSFVGRNTSPGVRDRRISGTKKKPLKIETGTRVFDTSESEASKPQPVSAPSPLIPAQPIPEPPHSALLLSENSQVVPNLAFKPIPSPGLRPSSRPSSRKGSSPLPGSDTTDMVSSTASALTKVTSADSDNSVPGSPARFGTKAATGLRKNFSSSSLRNKSLTVAVPEDADTSPMAPYNGITSTSKLHKVPSPAVPVLPTPIEASFITKGQPMGGIDLLASDIHSPNSPGSPNPMASNAPLPLEPCPETTLLRPFWFLRSIYQTIAHPRGGYISSRLFVPRDIWRVKNIKLKNVEEKISSCDLLTAALLKLGKVDTLDASAVLEEMQFFENVMDQVQATLSKKLGNDVGIQGVAQTFKGINAIDESTSNPDALAPKTANTNSKSYLSWRKLRSKNSVGPGSNSVVTTSTLKNGLQEAPIMKSLPMTTVQNPRFPKRDPNRVQCFGPNPSYMGALARLCDAVQVLGKPRIHGRLRRVIDFRSRSNRPPGGRSRT